jgi:hypothetical protein
MFDSDRTIEAMRSLRKSCAVTKEARASTRYEIRVDLKHLKRCRKWQKMWPFPHPDSEIQIIFRGSLQW